MIKIFVLLAVTVLAYVSIKNFKQHHTTDAVMQLILALVILIVGGVQ
jgi:hypothetical protein